MRRKFEISNKETYTQELLEIMTHCDLAEQVKRSVDVVA